MKQGRAAVDVSADQKREPIVYAMNVGGVSEIGCIVGHNPQNIHAGRGFTAPEPTSTTTHHCGSQGKHQ